MSAISSIIQAIGKSARECVKQRNRFIIPQQKQFPLTLHRQSRHGSFVIYRKYTIVTPDAHHTFSELAEGLVYRPCTLFCHIAGAIVQFVDSIHKARTTNLYSTGECYILSIILFLNTVSFEDINNCLLQKKRETHRSHIVCRWS